MNNPASALVFSPTWTIFGPLSERDGIPSPAVLGKIPSELRLVDRTLPAHSSVFGEGRLNLGALFGAQPMRTAAWVFCTVTADATGPRVLGFGADWWFEAFLDGQPLSNNMSSGGGHASPRAGLGLQRACQARAMLEGRDYVIPDDVQALAGPCLAHRVAGRAGSPTEPIIAQLVESVAVPR